MATKHNTAADAGLFLTPGGTVCVRQGGRTVAVAYGCSARTARVLTAGQASARAAVVRRVATLTAMLKRTAGMAHPATNEKRRADVAALNGWLEAWDVAHDRVV